MRKLGFAEMNAFVAIAERSSFAKAAVHLGTSRSALSETIRGLEEKLGVRLLNRTTRSVALTEVGDGGTYVWYRQHGRLSGVVQQTSEDDLFGHAVPHRQRGAL